MWCDRIPAVAGLRAAALAVLVLAVPELAAQEAVAGPARSALRPFWHVFIAYGLAWALVLGWVVSIARRLARLERTLGE